MSKDDTQRMARTAGVTTAKVEVVRARPRKAKIVEEKTKPPPAPTVKENTAGSPQSITVINLPDDDDELTARFALPQGLPVGLRSGMSFATSFIEEENRRNTLSGPSPRDRAGSERMRGRGYRGGMSHAEQYRVIVARDNTARLRFSVEVRESPTLDPTLRRHAPIAHTEQTPSEIAIMFRGMSARRALSSACHLMMDNRAEVEWIHRDIIDRVGSLQEPPIIYSMSIGQSRPVYVAEYWRRELTMVSIFLPGDGLHDDPRQICTRSSPNRETALGMAIVSVMDMI